MGGPLDLGDGESAEQRRPKRWCADVYQHGLGVPAARASRFTATGRVPACWSIRLPRDKKKKCEGHPGEAGEASQVDCLPTSCGSRTAPRTGSPSWDSQDGRPYEVFTVSSRRTRMYIPRKINKGFIIKVTRGRRHQALRLPVHRHVTAIRTPSAASRACSTRSSGTTPNLFRAYCATACRSRRRGFAHRVAPSGQRVDQHVENGRLPCAEAIYRGRHQVERQVSELRTGEYGLPERLSDLHVVRLFEMRLI